MFKYDQHLEKDLRHIYGVKFAQAALSKSHKIMLKECVGYKRLYNLYNSHNYKSKILFWLWNIIYSYHYMSIKRVELAIRLIRIGEVEWMAKIPNTAASYIWINWHQYKLENDLEFYGL